MIISARASDEYVECAIAITRMEKADAKKYLSYYNKLMTMHKKDNYITGINVIPIDDVTFYADYMGTEEIDIVQDIRAEITQYSLTFIGYSKYSDMAYRTRSIGIDELRDFVKHGKAISQE